MENFRQHESGEGEDGDDLRLLEASNATDRNTHANSSDEEIDRPQDQLIANGVRLNKDQIWRFNVIAKFIPEYTKYSPQSLIKGSFAFVIAGVVSITGLRVAGKYAGIWATTFGWSPTGLVALAATSNIVANIFVRSTRIVWAANTLRKMSARWKKNRMPLPDDGFIKNSIITQGLISLAATAPWVFLVFQALPENMVAKVFTIIFIPLLTAIVEASLALCGLTGYFDFDNQRQRAVYLWKHKILSWLRSLMSEKTQSLYTLDMLERAAQGQTAIISDESLNTRKALGIVMAACAGPYSVTVAYGVNTNLTGLMATETGACHPPITLNGGWWHTVAMATIDMLMVISGSTRFFLLSRANQNLAHRVLSFGDQPMFNINGYTVQTSSVKSAAWRNFFKFSLIILCLFLGFWSVGTASGLGLKNYFCDVGSLYSLLLTFAIGLGGAFGINVLSMFDAVDLLFSDVKKYINTLSSDYDANNRFGKNFDEMLLRASHNVAAMSVDDVTEKQLVTYDNSFKGDEEEGNRRGLSSQQLEGAALMRELGIYGNYADSKKTRKTQKAIVGLERTKHARLFDGWKDQASATAEDGVPHSDGLRHRTKPLKNSEERPFGNITPSRNKTSRPDIRLEMMEDNDSSPPKKLNPRALLEDEDDDVDDAENNNRRYDFT